MEPKVHAVLGQLHTLLSNVEPVDLERASRLRSISPFMRDALKALAKERNHELESEAPFDGARRYRIGSRSSQSPIDTVRRGDSEANDQVLTLISSAPRLSKKSQVEQFARTNGLPVSIRKKDSLRDAIRKLALAIRAAPEDVRRKLIGDVSASRDDQTEGWVKVIRKSH